MRKHADQCATVLHGEEYECNCDGYHTFDELYEHRAALLVALVKVHRGSSTGRREPWRSRQHHDGTMYDGHFIVGFGKVAGQQISYHLPLCLWDDFSHCHTWERAPEWDGHTPDDVIERLKGL